MALHGDLPTKLPSVRILLPARSTKYMPRNVARKFTANGTQTNQIANLDGNPDIRSMLPL
jgi:hypothetical protein